MSLVLDLSVTSRQASLYMKKEVMHLIQRMLKKRAKKRQAGESDSNILSLQVVVHVGKSSLEDGHVDEAYRNVISEDAWESILLETKVSPHLSSLDQNPDQQLLDACEAQTRLGTMTRVDVKGFRQCPEYKVYARFF